MLQVDGAKDGALRVEEFKNSADYLRRKKQMQGTYQTPLVGDNRQVSHLPPLPPPSRPWGRVPPGAAAAAATADATAAAQAKSPPSSSLVDRSALVDVRERTTCGKLPAELSAELSAAAERENEQIAGAVAAATGSPLPAAAGSSTASSPSTVAPGLQQPVHDKQGNGIAAARNTAGLAPLFPLPAPSTPTVVEVAPSIDDRPEESEYAAVAVTTENAAAAATGSGGSSSTGIGDPLAAMLALASTRARAARLAVESPVDSSGAVPTRTVGRPADGIGGGETSCRGEPADSIKTENIGKSVSAMHVATPPPIVDQSSGEGGKVADSTSTGSVVSAAVAAVTEKLTAVVSMAADKPACSQLPVPAGGGEHRVKLSTEIGTSASPTAQHSNTAGSKGSVRSSCSPGYSVEGWEGAGTTPASLPAACESPEPSSSLKGAPVPTLASAAGGDSSASPQVPAGATAAATKDEAVVAVPAAAISSAGRPRPWATVSEEVSAASIRPTSSIVAGRKRKLPMGATQRGGGGSVGGGGGGIGAASNCGSGRRSSGRGGGHSGTRTLLPPPPPPPLPLPELAFEEVAELVWDPRSGPKPRGAAEARGQAGTAASKSALERAMWDRDSTLLERVSPVHMEKSMQVLQTCRHDVERAAQTLTVRHGIHVVGLSSVRTTRNKRAEQQALSPGAARRCPSLAGTGSGGCGGSGGGGGGGSGGTGSGGASFEGWQSAAVSATTATTPVRAAAAAVVVAPRGCKQADAQGVTREGAKLAGDAFMRHGRDLNAVQKALGWPRNKVVEYYYCVWKYSPAYQVIFPRC